MDIKNTNEYTESLYNIPQYSRLFPKSWEKKKKAGIIAYYKTELKNSIRIREDFRKRSESKTDSKSEGELEVLQISDSDSEKESRKDQKQKRAHKKKNEGIIMQTISHTKDDLADVKNDRRNSGGKKV